MLNPATLVFMGFVLGWKWSALRLVLGVLMVVGLGWAGEPVHDTSGRPGRRRPACALTQQQIVAGNVFVRWMSIFTRMVVRLLPEYIVLVLLLGAARAWLFRHIGPDVTSGVGWIVDIRGCRACCS